MPENKNFEKKVKNTTRLCTLIALIPSLILIASIWYQNKPVERTDHEPFEFTIGQADSLPRCALIKGPENTFLTVQADNQIKISDDGKTCTITDSTREYDYYSYTTSLSNVLIFQTTSSTTIHSMRNQLGPAQVTCNSPDGKVVTGRAEKIYIHSNGACEVIIGNTWYCTDISNINIQKNSDES